MLRILIVAVLSFVAAICVLALLGAELNPLVVGTLVVLILLGALAAAWMRKRRRAN
jgi:hypothetical protein